MSLIDNKPLYAMGKLTLECPIICFKGQVTIESAQQKILNSYGWSGAEITLIERLFTCRYYDRQTPVILTLTNISEDIDISTDGKRKKDE